VKLGGGGEEKKRKLGGKETRDRVFRAYIILTIFLNYIK